MGRMEWENALEAVLSNPITFLETLTKIKGKPTRLYPKQRQYLLDDSRMRIILKARQCGFSKLITGEALYNACVQPMGYPEEILFVSTTERQAVRLLSKHFYDWYDTIDIAEIPKMTKRSKLECHLDNGSIIASLPNNPQGIRGYSPTHIYLDEFAHFSNDTAIMEALLPSLAHGGGLTMNSTPFGKAGWFYETWVNAVTNDPKKRNNFNPHKIMWYDVPKWLEEYHIFVNMMRKEYPKLIFRQEFECGFLEDALSPFPMRILTPCINIDNTCLKEHLSGERFTTLGMDLAKKVNQTAIVVTEHVPLEPTLRKRGDTYPFKRVVRHVSAADYNMFKLQLSYLDDIIKRYRPNRIYFDETSMGERIGEELYEKYGSRTHGVIFSNKSKLDMVNNLILLFEHEKVEIPQHRVLIGQLMSLQRTLTSHGNIKYKGEHDDFVWALALATYRGKPSSPLFAVETDEGMRTYGNNRTD